MNLSFSKHWVLVTAVGWLGACGDNNTNSPVTAPGADTSVVTRTLEAGAATLQGKEPIEALNAYLNGFHFYNGKMSAQMEAHHYCSILNEDVIQCVIYDSNSKQAKLMGVEYIVSAVLFKTLPDSEKPMWHSHVHEVKSGQLVAPGIPQIAEHALMEKLVTTYGKTWHTWHTDAEKSLPTGVPQLMMGFTADEQANPAMIASRDSRFGISSTAKRSDRAGITAPPIAAGADGWQHGRTIQLDDPTGAGHAYDHSNNRVTPPEARADTNASSGPAK